MPLSQFLTPDELVARYKGKISVKTLANWRTKGGGPAYVKIGGKVMYPVVAVQLWETSRVYGSAGEKVKITDKMRRLAEELYGGMSPPAAQ